MKRSVWIAAIMVLFIGALSIPGLFHLYHVSHDAIAQEKGSKSAIVKLPAPNSDGPVSVEKALSQRRSIRTYKDEPLNLAQVSQILWAAQGITEAKSGKRTAPSPMAMYLLDTYLVSGDVKGLPAGMYQYQPKGHQLVTVTEGKVKTMLFDAAGQAPIEKAPAALVLVGQADRSRSSSLMYLEAGHAAQNVYLQAVSLNLGTVVMAGFEPEEVRKALNLSENRVLIYIMPLGKR